MYAYMCRATAVALVIIPLFYGATVPAAEELDRHEIATMRMALAAISAGESELAEYYLEQFIAERGKTVSVETVALLASIYWERGKDRELLDHLDRFERYKARDHWWCRVLERRGHSAEAAACWQRLGEVGRFERAVRAETFLRTLVGEDVRFGLRHTMTADRETAIKDVIENDVEQHEAAGAP